MIATPTIVQYSPENYVNGEGIGIAKRATGVLGAGAVTLGLLFAMTQLISNDLPILEEEKKIVIPSINFVPIEQPPVVITVKPTLPEKAPPTPRDSFVENPFTDTDIEGVYDPVTIRDLPDIEIGGIPGGMALVPISPQYPESAARKGLCGHVVVQWDITADGIPTNIAVIDSSSRLFNKSAMRAVERARYKPHIEGGKAAMVRGKQEKITYQLDGGC